MGLGIVGRSLYDMGEAGAAAATIARRVLAGEHASDIPQVLGTDDHPIFDARQLQRWHVDGRLLPPGSTTSRFSPGQGYGLVPDVRRTVGDCDSARAVPAHR